MNIAVNQFAIDHHGPRKGSSFKGSWDNLINLVQENWDNREDGFTDGVVEVPLPPEHFLAGVVDLTTLDMEERRHGILRSEFKARDGMDEAPVIHTYADPAFKMQAKKVRVICYSHELLAAKGQNSGRADWEIVTILAEPFDEPAPMHPITMARNFLDLDGGTKGDFTAEDFAKSIMFWAQHAVCA